MNSLQLLNHDGADLRVSLVPPRTLSSGSTGRQQSMTEMSEPDEYLRLTHQSSRSGDRSHPVIAVNPDKSSFFHAMISYRVKTDAPFVTNMHSAMNLIASHREDLRMLDDFPWPKEFNRAESTGSSGVRIFLDKFCLRDGAQWEGSSQNSGGFVGAILKSLLFVPVFSAQDTFHGSVGQMARIWNPLWDAGLSSRKDGRGFKVTSCNTQARSHFLEHDVITAVDGEQVSSIDALWKSIAQKKESDSLCIEVEREISDKMFAEIQKMEIQEFGGGLNARRSSFQDASRFFQKPSLPEDDASFTIDIDSSNKLFFEELGLLQGDQVLLLSSVDGRVTAHNSAAFVTAVVQMVNTVSHSANPSCKILFKRSIPRPDYQDNVLLELILARELRLNFDPNNSALQPCAALFPIFRSEDVWKVSSYLSSKASTKTNEKVRSILQLNAIEPSVELKRNTLSPVEVFEYFSKFQGMKASTYGDEDNQIQACSEKVLGIIQDRAKSVSISFVKAHEGNTPQSIELRHWLQSVNLSYYARVLAHNNVSSLHALSQLDTNLKIMSKVAAEGAISSGRTHVSEYHELLSAVKLAKKSKLSQPLEDQFASFVDHDASFMTASFSSRACDIMFAKPTVQVIFFLFGIVLFAYLLYVDMVDFVAGDSIRSAANLAGLVACLSLITVALSYRFLEIKYARKSMYVVCFFMIACRIPSLVFAPMDPCFKDIQCLIPQRVMSTLWVWSCAIALCFFQSYLVEVLILFGVFVFFSYAVMGEYAFYLPSTFGLYSLFFAFLFIAVFLTFKVMRKKAFKKSAEIGNEHSEKMNKVWSKEIDYSSSGKALASLCPDSEQFKTTFSLLIKDIPNKDQIDVDSLIRVWETSTTSVLVKQEYTNIKRLFEEAEFCNEAFQTWVSSWLAGGSSREDFSDKHLSKKYSVSMERLYYQSSDEYPNFWKIISLGHLQSEDNRVKLLHRLHALFTSPPLQTDEVSTVQRQSFKAHFDEHAKQSIDRLSSPALIVGKFSNRVAFEVEQLHSCALCFRNEEEQVVVVLFADAFKIICEYMRKSTDDKTVHLSLHIQFKLSSETHKISQFIIISDDPESNPELTETFDSFSNIGRCDTSLSISLDEARKVFDTVDAYWTLISVNGRSDELAPPSPHDTFRKTDVVYANAITKIFLNSRWFGCQLPVAFNTEDIDPSVPTYSWIEVKQNHLEPLRIRIPLLSGRHIRGPIKQASRTISKVFRSYDGQVNRVTDVVRCVVVLDSPSDILKLIKKIIQNAWVEPCNPTLSYQLERLSLGLQPTLVSHMKFEDRVVIARRSLEYYLKCNILGFPRRTVKNSIEEAEKVRLQGRSPEMPHGAFELLRIRNRFSEDNPEGGYRDVNIKLKIGFRDSESTRHPVFLPVEYWKLPGVKRMVVEIQLHLKALHDTTQELSSVHYNYIEARNLRCQ